MRSLSFNINMC